MEYSIFFYNFEKVIPELTVACFSPPAQKRVAGKAVSEMAFLPQENKAKSGCPFLLKELLWLNSSSFSFIARFTPARGKRTVYPGELAAVIHEYHPHSSPPHWASVL